MRRLTSAVPTVWSAVLVFALTGPMWTHGGYGLARDMVFTPRYPFGPDVFGTGEVLPRAVPLDALLASLTSVVDGQVAFRVLVPGVLLLIAVGASRVFERLPTVARCATATASVWNPFVIERLALGQWALLGSLAALLWLWPAWQRVLGGDRSAWPLVVAATVLGSLTPTGGVLILLSAGAAAAFSGAWRRGFVVVLVTVLAQLPWLLPSLLNATATRGDAGGVEAFAARAESPRDIWTTLLTGGGIWSPFVVPASARSGYGFLLLGAVLVALVFGVRRVAAHYRGALTIGVLLTPVAGLAHLPGGPELLIWAIENIPGAGLLRDGHKWILPWVVVLVLCVAEAARRCVRWAQIRAPEFLWVAAGIAIVMPLLLLPDAAGRTWTALRPVTYPADLRTAVRIIDQSESEAAVVTVPYVSYRRFEWGNRVSAPDPLARWSSREVVVSDQLVTAKGPLAGESSRSQQVGKALSASNPSAALRALGVGWIVEYRDSTRPAAFTEGPGVAVAHEGQQVRLYRLVGEVAVRQTRVPWWAWTTFAGWLSVGLGAAVVAGISWIRGRAMGGKTDLAC